MFIVARVISGVVTKFVEGVGEASVVAVFIVATVISGVVAKFVEGVGGASVVAVFVVATVISGVVAKFVEGVGGASVVVSLIFAVLALGVTVKHSVNINFLVNRERLSILFFSGSVTGLEIPNTNEFPGPPKQMFEISPFLLGISFQYSELHKQRYEVTFKYHHHKLT